MAAVSQGMALFMDVLKSHRDSTDKTFIQSAFWVFISFDISFPFLKGYEIMDMTNWVRAAMFPLFQTSHIHNQ